MEAEASVRRRRPWLRWLLSIVGGGLFLWLASSKLRLWPEELTVVAPMLLVAAVGLHIPYAILRAMRLQYVLDPLVERASEGAQPRLDRNVLYGSGLVSFFILLVLPLKLGELSRPLLLTRGEQPGVRMTEAVGAVALERLIDGLFIVAMLFGGLALSQPSLDGDLGYVRTVGWSMLGVLAVGLVGLVIAARDPQWWSELAGRIAAVAGPKAETFAARVTSRFATTMRAVLDLRRSARFVLWSAAYWAVTVVQLWLVLQATGVPLGGRRRRRSWPSSGCRSSSPAGPPRRARSRSAPAWPSASSSIRRPWRGRAARSRR